MKAQINRVVIEINQTELLSQPTAALVVQTGPDLRLDPERYASLEARLRRQFNPLSPLDSGSAVFVDNVSIRNARLILAVVPRWSNGSEQTLVASATYECLQLAEKRALSSIALPALITGTRAYTIENCATTMLSQIVDFTFEDLEHVRAVTLCLPEPLVHEIFEQELINQIDELRRSGEGDLSL